MTAQPRDGGVTAENEFADEKDSKKMMTSLSYSGLEFNLSNIALLVPF
jgi:hypothetical protein